MSSSDGNIHNYRQALKRLSECSTYKMGVVGQRGCRAALPVLLSVCSVF